MLQSAPLWYLIQVGNYQSLSIAAEQLHISQPSLSVAIKKLEKEAAARAAENPVEEAAETPAESKPEPAPDALPEMVPEAEPEKVTEELPEMIPDSAN